MVDPSRHGVDELVPNPVHSLTTHETVERAALMAAMENRADDLTLLAAVEEWCSQELVNAVRVSEHRHTRSTLQTFSHPKLTTPDEWRAAGQYDCFGPNKNPIDLISAWRELENELRRKLESDELFLTAVRSGAVDPTPQPIQGGFAAEFAFDFNRSTIRQGEQVYLRVQVSQHAVPAREPSERDPAPPTVSIDTVRSLAPEVVAALLEMHAEHVRADLGVNLNQPGWASVIALVATKMQQRAERNELRPTLKEEALWLSEWAARVAPSYDTPSEKSVSNKLGNLYRNLKAARPVRTACACNDGPRRRPCTPSWP